MKRFHIAFYRDNILTGVTVEALNIYHALSKFEIDYNSIKYIVELAE